MPEVLFNRLMYINDSVTGCWYKIPTVAFQAYFGGLSSHSRRHCVAYLLWIYLLVNIVESTLQLLANTTRSVCWRVQFLHRCQVQQFIR
jgi:hypothetical protein